MARVYFKDGMIMEGRRCVIKRAIRAKLLVGRVPYRFSRSYSCEEINAYWCSEAGRKHPDFALMVRYGFLDREGNELC